MELQVNSFPTGESQSRISVGHAGGARGRWIQGNGDKEIPRSLHSPRWREKDFVMSDKASGEGPTVNVGGLDWLG